MIEHIISILIGLIALAVFGVGVLFALFTGSPDDAPAMTMPLRQIGGVLVAVGVIGLLLAFGMWRL